ncbi:MAG: DegT/DnrJ/EryC1/StrS family aminotransferase [Bacteroidales bacterium]|nr:DegT/DnrJ/EryC1/StrS family aminotransferase [Bacteroidales bacterium]
MKNKFIPVCEPYLGGNESKYVNDALNTGWISSSGKYVDLFEKMFAEFCGVKYATTVSNGTSAIHLGLKALGIKQGDEVIIPDFTMISSAFAVCYTGAKPVFVDAEIDFWNINPELIEEKITEKTKAIMVVHIYGHPCDMKPIWEIAKKHNLKIIEDSAETHGAEYFGKKCGNLGDIAAFSFFANKIATTGEGGMVTTNNIELIERARYYKNLCFPLSGERSYIHEDIGFQYRFSNVQAAIGVAQVEKINDYIAMRINNNKLFRELLSDIDGLTFQPVKENCKNVFWVNAMLIDKNKTGIERDNLAKKLSDAGIQTRNFFFPMHKQPAFIKIGLTTNESFSVSDYLYENGLYLPSGTNLSKESIEYISDAIHKIIKSA